MHRTQRLCSALVRWWTFHSPFPVFNTFQPLLPLKKRKKKKQRRKTTSWCVSYVHACTLLWCRIPMQWTAHVVHNETHQKWKTRAGVYSFDTDVFYFTILLFFSSSFASVHVFFHTRSRSFPGYCAPLYIPLLRPWTIVKNKFPICIHETFLYLYIPYITIRTNHIIFLYQLFMITGIRFGTV